jgi:1-phosphofructokinase family hexose kinase
VITVAALAPSLDVTYVVEELELGQIHRPVRAVRCAGGKPLNMARAVAALGGTVEVVAVLGGATGQLLHEALTDDGIAVVDVTTPAETRMCVSIAAENRSDLTEIYEFAAPIPADVWAALVDALSTAVRSRPGWLSISGGPPKELATDAIADVIRIGHAAGLQVAVDTHGAALPAAVATGPELIKINRYEAAELLSVPADTDLPALAEGVHERSRGRVVLTDAHRGAVALDGEDMISASLPDVHGRYPVGSGDAFLGALVTELDNGQSLLDGLRTATAAGAANALVPGPGCFERSMVDALRPRVRLSKH